jgi:hypothetical protein
MKRILLISLIIFFRINGFGQFLDNKASLYLGYETGFNLGNELFNNQGTSAPSFYSNFKSLNGLNFKGIFFKLSDHISTGLSTNFIYNTDWRSRHYTSFLNSNEISFSFKPVIQYHTMYSEKGIYNRLKLYGELSPVIGYSMASLTNINFVFISETDLNNSQLLKSNSIFYGLNLGGGAEYKLSNSFGIFANLSIQESFNESHIFIDNRKTALTFSIGTAICLSKGKRFNY